MNSENLKKGLYLHIPVCMRKCPYCDFFSLRTDKIDLKTYTDALCDKIGEHKALKVDTVYFGGGTPSLLGTDNILKILDSVYSNMDCDISEITIEVNPESADRLDFKRLLKNGVNRLSFGMQSQNDEELRKIARLHNTKMLETAVKTAQDSGIDNISLDVMIGLSAQTTKSLYNTVKYCSDLNVSHVSAYILKIEENTPYFKMQDKLNLPNEDTLADMYIFTVNTLLEMGFSQYEISNFCKDGKKSKHNLKYWNCDEYLGLGPSAYSFLNGKRFHVPRSLDDFYNGVTVYDEEGGSESEYIMLRLRLKDGVLFSEYEKRFNKSFPSLYIKKAEKLKDYVNISRNSISLTTKGFLLSNSVISNILF